MCLQGLCEQDNQALTEQRVCVLTIGGVYCRFLISSPLLCAQPPLHSAASWGGTAEEVKKLIAEGADVNAVDWVRFALASTLFDVKSSDTSRCGHCVCCRNGWSASESACGHAMIASRALVCR